MVAVGLQSVGLKLLDRLVSSNCQRSNKSFSGKLKVFQTAEWLTADWLADIM